MESGNTSQENAVTEPECPSILLKRTCLSSSKTDQETPEQIVMPKNGLPCNGTMEVEGMQVSHESKGSEDLPDLISSTVSEITEVEDKIQVGTSEHVKGKISVNEGTKSSPSKDVPHKISAVDNICGFIVSGNVCGDKFGDGLQTVSDIGKIDEDDSFQNVNSTQCSNETSTQNCTEAKSVVKSENVSVKPKRKSGRGSNQGSEIDKEHGSNFIKEAKDTVVSKSTDEVEEIPEGKGHQAFKEDITDTVDVQLLNVVADREVQNGCSKDKDTAGHEKYESPAKRTSLRTKSKCKKIELPKKDIEVKKNERNSDFSTDDIEILGESRVVPANKIDSSLQSSQNLAFVPGGPSALSKGFPVAGNKLLNTTSMHNSPLIQGKTPSPALLKGFTPGNVAQGMHMLPPRFVGVGGVPGQGSQNLSLFVPTVAPPKPKSSLDQIELIRWEIQNRINTRPKYFKPSPSSDLGPLAKFLFDIGSDLIKEAVYHDLVKIQSKKNSSDKLGEKEKEDLIKLKQIEKDLFATVGHLKLKLKKRCKVCNFQTESHNVMFCHKQYPHEDQKFMRCAHCTFVTKQAVAFKFHVETEHGIQPKLHDKKAFYECDLCPYENNQEQKLTLHRQRCIKQFRPLFNLHPSCLSGAEINLCLENIFYRPLVPKNLKFLQQKHAQQQAALAETRRQQSALAETRRQQAEMQALAAQKNAVAVSTKKQQQPLKKNLPPTTAAGYNVPPDGRVPGQQQPVNYNTATSAKSTRLTVASMINSKQNPVAIPPSTSPNAAAGGFEVCEICGGYVKDRKALRIHFFYAHRIDLPFNLFERTQAPLYCATCYVRFWTAQGLRKHIDSHKEEKQTRGVVGKCISCGHHVLNLLLHMRVVHSREMQHYVHALICMFCGGKFSSRQECERHIFKVHGHIDPVTGTVKPSPNAPVQPQPPKVPSNQKKAASNSLVKGSVCVLCNLNFGRNVDLTRHCMRMHHTCMKCGMVVIDKASLVKHACLSSSSGTRNCSVCGEIGFHPAYYVKHLRDRHLKKFTISVAKLSTKTIERWTKCPYPSEETEEVLVEISDSDDDGPPNKIKSSIDTAAPIKRQKIGPASKIGRSENNTQAVEVVEIDDQEQYEKEAVETVVDSVREVVDTVEDSVSEVADTVEDSVSEVADSMEDSVSEVADAVEDSVNEVADTVEDSVNEVADTVEDSVNEVADAVVDSVSEVADAVVDSMKETAETMEDFMKEQDVANTIVDDVKEVADLSPLREIDSADDDNRTDVSPRGEKRKSESPSSEKPSKRKKSS